MTLGVDKIKITQSGRFLPLANNRYPQKDEGCKKNARKAKNALANKPIRL
jgi:hypothetical protein